MPWSLNCVSNPGYVVYKTDAEVTATEVTTDVEVTATEVTTDVEVTTKTTTDVTTNTEATTANATDATAVAIDVAEPGSMLRMWRGEGEGKGWEGEKDRGRGGRGGRRGEGGKGGGGKVGEDIGGEERRGRRDLAGNFAQIQCKSLQSGALLLFTTTAPGPFNNTCS